MDELQWRIYYDDGSDYSNLDGAFKDAPSDGVLAAVFRDPQTGYKIRRKKDYYFLMPDDGTIGETDDLGPFLRKTGLIKFGRWVSGSVWEKEYRRIVEEAREDFGLKSGD
jgi:hypothetical protein